MNKSRIRLLVGLVLVISFMLIIVTESTGSDDDRFVLVMERHPCFGSCQAYTLIIYSDGTVYYSGDFNVREYDDVITKINPSQVKRILYEIEQSKIFNENYSCCQVNVMDTAYVDFNIIRNGHVAHASYPIGDYNIPYELRHMECTIDEIVNSKQWIGRNFLCEGVLNESPQP